MTLFTRIDIIIHDSQIIDLIDIPKPESSYIILETLGKEKQPHKVFYVVLATNNGVIKLVHSFKGGLIKLGTRT